MAGDFSSRFEQIASVWGTQPTLMAILNYFDASGDATHPALGVGGFLARPDQWAAFNREWRAVLDAEGVRGLHMKHFAHSRGEFAGWKGDEPRRAAFLGRLTGVINDHTLKSVSVCLFNDHYNDFNKVFLLKETLGGPYAFTSLFAMNLSMVWRDQHQPGEAISFVFESGDHGQFELLDTLGRLKIADAFNVTFMPKHLKREGETVHHYPFQACDFLAYEHAKASRSVLEQDAILDTLVEEVRARKSFIQVAPTGRDFTRRYIDTGLMREFCLKLQVKRRPS